MRVLFVHGMGRTPLSGWPLLRRLRQAGLRTTTFGYTTTFENFNTIKLRLISKVSEVAGAESYILVGHSLGGVLIRAALNALPEHVERPRHVFLLGSPIQPSSLAVRLKNNWVYHTFTGDCGQLLASQVRMNEVGTLNETSTSIAGVRGFVNGLGQFGSEPNDGVVSVIEVSAPWLSNQKLVPVVHTLLPASVRVAEVILRELRLAPRRNRKQELPSPDITNQEVGNQRKISKDDAYLLARDIAREIVSGELSEYDGGMKIWKEVINKLDAKCPDDLWPFKSNASAIEDIKWNAEQGGDGNESLIRQCEQEILVAARKLAR